MITEPEKRYKGEGKRPSPGFRMLLMLIFITENPRASKFDIHWHISEFLGYPQHERTTRSQLKQLENEGLIKRIKVGTHEGGDHFVCQAISIRRKQYIEAKTNANRNQWRSLANKSRTSRPKPKPAKLNTGDRIVRALAKGAKTAAELKKVVKVSNEPLYKWIHRLKDVGSIVKTESGHWVLTERKST